MKKILIATTALVATAGIASAEMSLSGSAAMGVIYNGTTDTTVIDNEIDFGISGSGTADNGLTFGASLDLDYTEQNQVEGPDYDDPEVFISFGGATLTLGDVDSADDIGGIGDPGYQGIGVDGENSAQGDHDINLAYDISNFTFAVSYGSNTDDYGVGVEGSFDAFNFALGTSRDDAADTEVVHLTLGYASGPVSTNLYVEELDVAGTSFTNYGVDFEYTMNQLTVIVAAADGDSFTDVNFGVGAEYDLGGGLALAGGLGQVAGELNADLGVTMDF